jgi:hypothetical protein
MPRKTASQGQCVYCGKVITSSVATRHLSACPKRLAIIEDAERNEPKAKSKSRTKSEALFHLRVKGEGRTDYWLNLEARGSSTLDDLDGYLRSIWLECCDHLSMFTTGGWSGEEIEMNTKLSQVFEPGVELTHFYDFGTTSTTVVRCVAVRQGHPTTKHPIALMARNLMPEHKCVKCAEPATMLCIGCLYETGELGTLCAKHAETDPHGDYGDPMPLVNSPRSGMCGYDGPAEPPY